MGASVALTRGVSPAIASCELTHLARVAISLERAREQHARYEEALESLGCRIVRLPPDPDLPDSVFVEDTAVVLDELAVIAFSGAPSRRGERAAVAEALAPHREVVRMTGPGTLDGGDVLPLGRTLCVGLSSRTGPRGLEELGRLVTPRGYEVLGVPVRGCLHLKSAVTQIGDGLLLANRSWVDPLPLEGFEVLDVDPEEPFAANALLVGDTVLHDAAHARTRERMERRGIRVAPVDLSELAKAEGGVTCCSLVFEG